MTSCIGAIGNSSAIRVDSTDAICAAEGPHAIATSDTNAKATGATRDLTHERRAGSARATKSFSLWYAPRVIVDAFWSLRKLGRVFWISNAVYCLDGAAYFGILNILTLFLGQDVALGDVWAGYTVSYFTGMMTLFSATLGGVTDRLGVRRTLTITIVAALAGRALLTFAPSLPLHAATAWIGLTLMAFSAGAMQPAVYAGVKQSTTPETSAVGYSLLYSLSNGGLVVVSFASSPVRARFGTTGVIAMCGLITVVYLLVHVVGFPRNAGGPVETSEARKKESKLAGLRGHALANPRFLYFIFVLLGVRTLFAHQWLTMPDYITRAYSAEIGARLEWIVAVINGSIILVFTPLVAALTRRVHVVTMMIAGTVVSAGATFLLVPAPVLWALLGYQIVFSFGEAMWSSRFYEYVAETAPPDKVGVYMGVAQIPWFIAKFTTGFYSGSMLEVFCPKNGPQRTGTMWLVYGVVGMTSPVGLLVARRWLTRGSIATRS
jgi:MFS family permease